MPASRAIASRCSTPFVEPPRRRRPRRSRSRTPRASGSATAGCRRGRASSRSSPACTRGLRLAGMRRRDARSGPRGLMPRKSSTIAIVFAVNWPPHAPAPGHATLSSACTSLVGHRPGGVRADRLEDVLDRHVAARDTGRARSSRRRRRARGGRGARAPSPRPGSSCRSRRGRRARRTDARATTSSIESAITSREISERAHPGRPHRHAVGDRDRVELDRRAARGADALLHVLREHALVEVARHRLDPRRRDADQRLREILVGEADRLQHRARGARSTPSVSAALCRFAGLRRADRQTVHASRPSEHRRAVGVGRPCTSGSAVTASSASSSAPWLVSCVITCSAAPLPFGAAAGARPRCRARRARRRRARARPAGRRPRGGSRKASGSRRPAAAAARATTASFCRKPVPIVPITLTMSAITADAVSMPPAPGPSSVISRIASPCSITALNAPSTSASGWWRSTSAGPTLTSTLPSVEPRHADEANHHVELARGRDVERRRSSSMPPYSTSSSPTRELKATVARIAIFAAASAPRDVVGRVGLRVAALLRLARAPRRRSCPPPSP